MELQIADSKIITQANLVLAQQVDIAKSPLDLVFQLVAGACEFSRYRRFMLARQAPDFLKRQLVPVVVSHPHPILWRERVQREVERSREHSHVARALGSDCIVM